MIKRIAIVGAGFAGLTTAKLFRDHGFDVVVFEKDKDVGGVWAASRRYPGLTTQNPGPTYALSDFPMPASYPEWPSGAQMQAYFESYVETFGLRPLLRLACPVTHADYDPVRMAWRISWSELSAGRSGEDEFDYLIICNGIFSAPDVPSYEGQDDWEAAGGRILHTSQFNDVDDVRGKHALVIGYGKSSCDAARATLGISASTSVVARKLIWKIPRRLAGVLNFKHLFLTRMGEGLFQYFELKGFEKFLHGAGRPLRNTMLASVQGIVSRQFHLERIGLHPHTPISTIANSTVSLVTDGFYESIANGDLSVKRDAEIVRLSPGHALLSTGETVKADMIIAGTGWRQEVPFLSPDIARAVTDAEGNFLLYRSMIPLDTPRLAFNGYNSSFFSQLSCEAGAFWLLNHIRSGEKLPDHDICAREIARRLKWMQERTGGKHCKGTNIVPFSMHHIDELLDDIGLNVSGPVKLKQWFVAVNPSDYAWIYDGLRERFGSVVSTRDPSRDQADIALQSAG